MYVESFYYRLKSVLALLFIFYLSSAGGVQARTVHAISTDGAPKYKPGFTHFDYVNPHAPQGSELKCHSIGTFDSFNPLLLKGRPAEGIHLIYDTLLVSSEDEADTTYGLLAKEIRTADDLTWIEFDIDPNAKFHDGSPVTAEDVVFSWNMLITHFGSGVRRYFSAITAANAIRQRTVRFEFSEPHKPELAQMVGQIQVLPHAFWKTRDFDKADLTIPMGSGPYRIKEVVAGKRVVYEKVENYWAKDHPVNRGRWNFSTIRYTYFRDDTVALEAFKAGLYDFRFEGSAKNWASRYNGPRFDDGRITKEEIHHKEPKGMRGLVMNTRRPVFQDPAVRRALMLAFDFTWANKRLFYGQYQRIQSYFENSDLKAPPLPGDEERKILEPFRDQLPKALFDTPHHIPETDGSGQNRENLIAADRLLTEAGWIIKYGKRIHKKTGRVLRFQFLTDARRDQRMMLPFLRNLKRLAIEMQIHMVEPLQFTKQLRSLDFDMIVSGFSARKRPGKELLIAFHSEGVNRKDYWNFIGLDNPVVDTLIEKILTTHTRETMIPYAHALDRVLLWGDYVIPFGTSTKRRLALATHIERPETAPGYGNGISTWYCRE